MAPIAQLAQPSCAIELHKTRGSIRQKNEEAKLRALPSRELARHGNDKPTLDNMY